MHTVAVRLQSKDNVKAVEEKIVKMALQYVGRYHCM